MSREVLYQVEQCSTKTMDGISLPSFPTTTYWYDAHSSVGSSLYPTSDGLPAGTTYKASPHLNPKAVESERDMVWWTEDACIEEEQRTTGAQYYPDHPAKRSYSASYDRDSTSREPQGPSVVYRVENNEPEYQNTTDAMRLDQDDNSVCSESLSSHSHSPSNYSSDFSLPSGGKKSSPEPYLSADDPRRSQKRLRKDPKDKCKEDKRCGVCGDAARSMHFGGMACDSCKAFFRRSVQSGAYKTFQCPENKDCPISKQNRKVCQYCRFKKSQENGMEISWVMSETDRMVLWKNRLAKQRHVQEEKVRDRMYGDLPRALDPDEADKLRNLTTLQEVTFSAIPYPEDCYGDSVECLANTFVCICKKLSMFFYRIEEFHELSKMDQNLLLKNGIGMAIYLHGAYMYDAENGKWPAESNKEALKVPPISMETVRRLAVLPEAFHAIMKFYTKYGSDLKDEIILALICIIAFFQPDDPQFQDHKKIQDIQLKYLEYLRHYLLAKEGDTGVKVTFPKLLVGLADVKEILEFHSKVDIKPTINHQKISTQSSVKHQIATLSEIFQKASKGLLPEFSSVLTAADRSRPQLQRWSLGRRKKRSGSGVSSDQMYHPLTNQIFGPDPRTDMLITNPLDQMDQFLRKNGFQLTPSTSSSTTSSCQISEYHGEQRQRLEHQRSIEGSIVGPSRPLDHRLQVVQGSRHSRPSQLMTGDKKRVVEVLCDVLRNISCYDNNDAFVTSLKQSLPPHLLSSLAQKLAS